MMFTYIFIIRIMNLLLINPFIAALDHQCVVCMKTPVRSLKGNISDLLDELKIILPPNVGLHVAFTLNIRILGNFENLTKLSFS